MFGGKARQKEGTWRHDEGRERKLKENKGNEGVSVEKEVG